MARSLPVVALALVFAALWLSSGCKHKERYDHDTVTPVQASRCRERPNSRTAAYSERSRSRLARSASRLSASRVTVVLTQPSAHGVRS